MAGIERRHGIYDGAKISFLSIGLETVQTKKTGNETIASPFDVCSPDGQMRKVCHHFPFPTEKKSKEGNWSSEEMEVFPRGFVPWERDAKLISQGPSLLVILPSACRERACHIHYATAQTFGGIFLLPR